MVRPRRFELLTYSFGGCRSIQLSYGRTIHIRIRPRSISLQSQIRQIGAHSAGIAVHPAGDTHESSISEGTHQEDPRQRRDDLCE
jgi:hypothetical protein